MPAGADPGPRLVRLLEALRTAVSEVERVAPIAELTERQVRHHPARPIVEDLLWRIYGLWDGIDEAQRDVLLVGESPAVLIPAPLAEFLRHSEPLRDKLVQLTFSTLRLEFTPGPESPDANDLPQDGVRDVLIAAWERFKYKFEGGDFGHDFDEDDVRAAGDLVRARFFSPEAWHRNLARLTPLHVSKEPGQFPTHIRSGLREIYDSFTFGNGMAVVALCRSILERALLDRGKSLGIEPRTTYKGRSTPRKLAELVEDLSERRPDLRNHLELVTDYGNDVMHAARRPELLPSSLMLYAMRSLGALRIVLEKIYSH